MFTGFTENTIQFFLDLKFHNNAIEGFPGLRQETLGSLDLCR